MNKKKKVISREKNHSLIPFFILLLTKNGSGLVCTLDGSGCYFFLVLVVVVVSLSLMHPDSPNGQTRILAKSMKKNTDGIRNGQEVFIGQHTTDTADTIGFF